MRSTDSASDHDGRTTGAAEQAAEALGQAAAYGEGQPLVVTGVTPNLGPRTRHQHPEVEAGTTGTFEYGKTVKGRPVIVLRVDQSDGPGYRVTVPAGLVRPRGVCPLCGGPLPPAGKLGGRPSSWCSTPHRQAAHRARQAVWRAADSAAAVVAQLAVTRAELNSAMDRLTAAYGQMTDAEMAAGDDVDQALRTGLRWEEQLTAAARAVASAAHDVGELSRGHARYARDYCAARAAFRYPDAPGALTGRPG